ncbi:hypothetical protein BGX27_003039 [Mortierella sp. AM989]|nr:hypothetical protein BGX27_003039 [Mortierella sp. AM989]
MIDCLRKAVEEANKTKRQAQTNCPLCRKGGGGYLEPKDREYLGRLCQRAHLKDADEGEDGSEDHTDDNTDNEPDSSNTQNQFPAAFLRHLYSGTFPKK